MITCETSPIVQVACGVAVHLSGLGLYDEHGRDVTPARLITLARMLSRNPQLKLPEIREGKEASPSCT